MDNRDQSALKASNVVNTMSLEDFAWLSGSSRAQEEPTFSDEERASPDSDFSAVGPYDVNAGERNPRVWNSETYQWERSDPQRETRGRDADDDQGQGLSDIPQTTPVEFNPPLHPSMRMTGQQAMPDYHVPFPGGTPPDGYKAKTLADNFGAGDTDINFPAIDLDGGEGSTEVRDASVWRLGQIMTGTKMVPNDYAPNLKVRYGFRFLYNPTSITFSTGINESVFEGESFTNDASMFMSDGMGSINLNLFLNRIPDVTQGSPAPKPDKSGHFKGEKHTVRGESTEWSVHTHGTEFDMEYLFRTINGVWNVVAPGETPRMEVKDPPDPISDPENTVFSYFRTGNIGLLQVTPVWITIGPTMKYYGRITNIAHEHIMFNSMMVPMLTQLNITFQRIYLGSQEDIELINNAASLEGRANLDPDADYSDYNEGPGSGGGGSGSGPPGSGTVDPTDMDAVSEGLTNGPGDDDSVKNTRATLDAVNDKWPQIVNIGGWRDDGIRDHPHGLALDLNMPDGTNAWKDDPDENYSNETEEGGNEIVKWLISHRQSLGIKYIMWNRDLWSRQDSDQGLDWDDRQPNRGIVDPYTAPTHTHEDHIHVCCFPSAEYDTEGKTPWHIYEGSYWQDGLEPTSNSRSGSERPFDSSRTARTWPSPRVQALTTGKPTLTSSKEDVDLDAYLGDSPSLLLRDKNFRVDPLYQKVDGKWWIANAPSEYRSYPRNTVQAVNHALEYIASGIPSLEDWKGRPMSAIARCFGLDTAKTEDIPPNVPGMTTSPARQFRWLEYQYPDMVRRAPSTRSFGTAVPIGAILYWDGGTANGYGSVGIAIGYRNGILQQITTEWSGMSLAIKDVQPNRCLGWSVPVFYEGSTKFAHGLRKLDNGY